MLHSAHRRIRRDVEAYADGELAGLDRVADIEAHLDACADCRHALDVQGRVKCSLRRLAANRPTDLTAARLRRWVHGLTQ